MSNNSATEHFSRRKMLIVANKTIYLEDHGNDTFDIF